MDRKRAFETEARRQRPGSLQRLGLAVLLALTSAALASAQETHSFSASLQGSLGGALGADEPDPGLGNIGLHLGFSWVTQPRTSVLVRLGQVKFSDEQLERLFDPELSYAAIAGQYTYGETYYVSGLFLGIGLYNLEGLLVAGEGAGQSADDTSIGVVFGVTGDFPITRRFSFVAELTAHYADLDETQLFAFAHAGVAFHF